MRQTPTVPPSTISPPPVQMGNFYFNGIFLKSCVFWVIDETTYAVLYTLWDDGSGCFLLRLTIHFTIIGKR